MITEKKTSDFCVQTAIAKLKLFVENITPLKGRIALAAGEFQTLQTCVGLVTENLPIFTNELKHHGRQIEKLKTGQVSRS